MTAGRSRVDAATVRRRLMLAAEASTLPYQPSDGDTGGGVDLGVLLDAADAAVGRLGAVPAEQIHPDGLAGALTRLRKVRNRLEAVETSWLTQVRNRKVHRDEGASSASKWAAERLGGSQRDASDQIRTADLHGRADGGPTHLTLGSAPPHRSSHLSTRRSCRQLRPARVEPCPAGVARDAGSPLPANDTGRKDVGTTQGRRAVASKPCLIHRCLPQGIPCVHVRSRHSRSR